MAKSALAFAPGHISGYFRRVDGRTARETGSLGAGVVTDKGVFVKMTGAKITSVKINGQIADGWLIEKVLDGRTAQVEVTTELPIGAGFGMSAAGLLASFYAANELFSLGMTKEDILEATHAIEVESKTGLGDVAAEAGGGIVVRTEPGISGVKMRMYPQTELYALSFGGIKTSDVITSPEKMQQVSAAFPEKLPANVEEFMANALSFTKKSGLATPRIMKILDFCASRNIPASMTMLGEGVFTFGPKAKAALEQFGTPYALKVSKTGPYLMEIL
ncbi:MAG TPA: GHMP kinase [Methanocorpusculum sp.]|nr:GHMP kinase [Methanocorpusculum sp.]